MPEPGTCMKNGQAAPDLKTGGVACRSTEDCRLRAGTQKDGFRCMALLKDASPVTRYMPPKERK